MLAQAARYGVRDAAVADASCEAESPAVGVRVGPDAAERLVREVGCDLVVGAIVGVAGLPAVLAALERGTDVALANKETLVAAGSLVVPLAAARGARILPVDSEHAGVWQCLQSCAEPDYAPPMPAPADVAKVTLTASGGAFRGRTLDDVRNATPEEALAHPTWDMGAKVTVDSATLVNKALELIEAHWLFGLGADRLDAVIHPTSTVHALVEMGDGSVVAQLGAPDMRTPIVRALAFPNRCPEPLARLDLLALGSLEFRPIAGPWRKAIDLGLRAIRVGGDAGAVFNAANEAAVRAFLDRRIPFGRILEVVEAICSSHEASPVRAVDDVLDADRAARSRAEALIRAGGGSQR
jgi:1-deoxy-D-xylulose-5-phosphate reductoisomerase